jgi:hypothetical protein
MKKQQENQEKDIKIVLCRQIQKPPLEVSYLENCTISFTQSGAYWVTNNFIWTWLLLPFLPLSEVLKVHVATASRQVKKNDLGYQSS